MRNVERFLLVMALVVGVVALLASRGVGVGGVALAQDGDGGEVGEVAYVNGYTLLDELVRTNRFAPDLEAVEAEFEEEMQPLQDQMLGLQEEARALSEQGQTPDAMQAMQGLQQEAQRLQIDMQALQAEFGPRLEEIQRNNLQQSWDEMRAAAEAVAESQGFKYVILAEDPEDNLNEVGDDANGDGKTDSPGQEILKRTMLVAPEGADITADVRADLNLE